MHQSIILGLVYLHSSWPGGLRSPDGVHGRSTCKGYGDQGDVSLQKLNSVKCALNAVSEK